MRRVLPWAALGVVVLVVLVLAAWPDSGTPTPQERARDLATELRCPDCEGLSVADSSTSSARAIRADLRRRLLAGESEEDVRRAYVDRYGESILLKPEGSGLGVLVWGLPVVVLVVGAGGLALALARWRREPHLQATAADEALVDETRRSDPS
ncbi:MAG: cytochrome c-type biogenesis protein CcmH [Acidimicrobiia bacterium]|nr:cytochrome c-type biogenesis protein CcmH [Acidimicrobiia bacterium]